MTTDSLSINLPFYEAYGAQVIGSRLADISGWFGLSPAWKLANFTYPWGRTFEIGLFAERP
jgi:hypothetical protein